MKLGHLLTCLSQVLCGVIFLLLSSCEPAGLTVTIVPSVTQIPIATTVPSVTPTPIATTGPSLTPSPIPTYPLDLLRDKLPATPPAYGFVVLEVPESVNWDGLITLIILTVPGSDCSILYWGTSGLSHSADLDPKIADANGICSWTWKQAQILGKSEGDLPIKARISITAGDRWGDYYLPVK
jgi:hypothetical protein